MAKTRITDLVFYRWRYAIGYSIIALALAALLAYAGLFAPGGITTAEMEATVKSAGLDFSSVEALPGNIVINLPYHLLQLGSITLFEATIWSIKLPSLALGLLSAIGMIFLLRRWFRYNVAVTAAIIAITTGQFLFLSQNGTSSILYIFWPVWLLLSAAMIARGARPAHFWCYLFFILAGLSLYTPLSIYVLLAIASAVVLHPHLRYLFKQIPKADLIGGSLAGLIIASPLVYQIVMTPELGLHLLGFPAGELGIRQNVLSILGQYFNFTTSVNEYGMMLPVFGLGSVLLIIIGLITLLRTRHTVKSYIVTAWMLLLLPILLINPEFTSITFVPLLLVLASGLSVLFSLWYRIFPKNPYARIAGLIPLGILVTGLVISGVDRYIYGYEYNPEVRRHFSRDARLVRPELSRDSSPATLVVPAGELSFYSVVAAKSGANVEVISSIAAADTPKVIVAGNLISGTPEGFQLSHIVTDDRAESADRFYIYKNMR